MFSALLPLLAATLWAQDAAPKPKSLDQRLGGYDMIAKIVDDFGPKLGKDPKIAPHWPVVSAEHRMRNRQLIVEQICEGHRRALLLHRPDDAVVASGAGHHRRPFQAGRGALMLETLDKFKIGEPERSELMGIIGKLAI